MRSRVWRLDVGGRLEGLGRLILWFRWGVWGVIIGCYGMSLCVYRAWELRVVLASFLLPWPSIRGEGRALEPGADVLLLDEVPLVVGEQEAMR